MFTGRPYLLLMLGGMLFSVLLSLSSSHWLVMWAGMEINIICFLPIMVSKKSNGEIEAAVTYFLFQSIGSLFLAAGSLYSYAVSFTWEPHTDVGTLLVMTGLLVKLGAAPFHWWFPPVMTKLSWQICLILATWQKVAPLTLLSSIEFPVASFFYIPFFAFCSALVGGIGGMNQTQVRPLLAFSSVGHLGWMLMASVSSGHITVLYLLSYTFINLTVFEALARVSPYRMNALSKSNMTPTTIALMVCLLSLAGLPPLLGFVPKLLVFVTALHGNPAWWVLLVLIGGSLMSLYYYLSLWIKLHISSFSKAMQWSWKTATPFFVYCMILHLTGGLLLFLYF